MRLFERDIWSIFYILTAFFTMSLIAVAYSGWHTIYKQYQTSQENSLKLIANSTHSLYQTNGIMLEIVGHRFIEDVTYKDNTNSMKILDAALLESPAITAIAIVNPQGQMLFATNGLDVARFPNLLKQEDSRESFLAVMQSHHMMFGRTYYFKPFNDWIVPIRKAIRDNQGNVKLVITAALRLDDSFGFMIKNVDQNHQYAITIIRDADKYIQYASNGSENNYEIYRKPLSQERIDVFEKSIKLAYGATFDELKRTEHLLSLPYKTEDGVEQLASLKYDSTYKLWLISMTEMAVIKSAFAQLLMIYITIFVAIEIILYALVKVIFNADKKRNSDLLYQATHDQLTGMPNRSYLQTNIYNWIHDSSQPFSILYLDLDRFKSINDSFGHQCGDQLLLDLARRLQLIIPRDSTVIRHGGDEFVVLTPLVESREVLGFAKTIIDTITKPYTINNLKLHIGASIGIAQYPLHGESFDTLLRSADIAMYESKKIKNSIHLFENSMAEGYLQNVKIEQALRNAISDNELFMVYQPQVTPQGDFYGVEALVRWQSGALGLVAPDCFIPVAETSGQMPAIGQFIVQQTLKDIKEIQSALARSFQTSINISVRQLMEPGFTDDFINCIKDNNLDNISITLEITESLFIEDIHSIRPLLDEIKGHGLSISMDDFGTGYSSLSILRNLPIDELKIDKSFIECMFIDEASQKMVKNIIMIGKNLGMDIVAEGVEMKEQLDILKVFGCDRVQGYYFSKPLKKDQLIQFILNTKRSM
ncbi:EAL domain-containing protein [uncultured Amphritea sp.]|mgnify:CR=1 FL=1|uniref:bifunctional diguanylate cyclase/phosphodiesterase n=1 Tax=uncultured Amphritea sp. TaxID=981605 RepID=UPI00262E5258|nr:EAL domain-containing protein [uncultured Amphritea sp.]